MPRNTNIVVLVCITNISLLTNVVVLSLTLLYIVLGHEHCINRLGDLRYWRTRIEVLTVPHLRHERHRDIDSRTSSGRWTPLILNLRNDSNE